MGNILVIDDLMNLLTDLTFTIDEMQKILEVLLYILRDNQILLDLIKRNIDLCSKSYKIISDCYCICLDNKNFK